MFLDSQSNAELRRGFAECTAPFMLALSLVFLVCQAVLVVILVDMPNFSEHAGTAIDPNSSTKGWLREIASTNGVELAIYDWSVSLIWIVWPIVVIEAGFHWLSRPWDDQTRKLHFFSFLFCICPSLRMCARSHEKRNRLWLPGLGWRYPNKRLRARLERHFSLPMIAIALLILPVLVIEFFLHDRVEGSVLLWSLLHVGTGVIWLAFAIEFILMVSVAEKKIAYCKEHWLDLAILLLPLISFLRSVQFIRATNALRLPQFTKMLRVYRMRGTALKALRGLIVLDLFSRFFKAEPEQMVEQLQADLREAEAKVRVIRRKLTRAQQIKMDANAEAERGAVAELDQAGLGGKGEAVQSGVAVNQSEVAVESGPAVGSGAVVQPEPASEREPPDEQGASAVPCNGSQDVSHGEHCASQKTRVNRITTVVAPPQNDSSQSKRPK
ncbi:MAG: potassium channel protein [Rhodopirellula sp.]|nr:potassium channel protein [Rhodopirellula sp.]